MFHIIHISDLHRTGDDPLTNDELLNGMVLDITQLADLRVADFKAPDAIIVSGDLVQGVRVNDPDYPDSLQKQNAEALDLLTRLCDTFLGGDRKRMVLLQGHHDVDRRAAKDSMVEITDIGELNLAKEISKPQSKYRWCWRERALHRIDNETQYDTKLDAYRDLVNQFYSGVNFQIPFDAARRWNHFVFEGGIVVTAFDNCRYIDGFCNTAVIAPTDVAQATQALGFEPTLKIAAWHHNVGGPPQKSDYLDASDLNAIVNSGYRLGLHGHQHRPDVAPHGIHTSADHEMTVVSVGSLGAADDDLAPGCHQQFNLVRVDTSNNCARIWVREMIYRGVFGAGSVRSRTAETHFDAGWTKAPPTQIVNSATHGGPDVEIADQIERLISDGQPNKALEITESAMEQLGEYGIALKARCLFDASDWLRIVDEVQPVGVEELNMVVKAHVELLDFDKAEQAINLATESGIITTQTGRDLLKWVSAERKLKS